MGVVHIARACFDRQRVFIRFAYPDLGGTLAAWNNTATGKCPQCVSQ